MNDQEVTTYQPLEAQSTALKAAGIAIALVRRVPSLADQVVRSASSVPANLSEGHGRFGKDRQYHYSVAYGSAKEVDVHLRILLQ
ncbi:MAG: four helix bundle protein, partial [bacterium]|nr:four helix bundle protein [bacterium]